MSSSIYSALGLSRNPFPSTPDAGAYFFTPSLEEDFAEILHCVEARKGFVLITGEVGLGKSTLVRRLLDTLEGKACHSALILNTFLQGNDLLSAIQSDFDLQPAENFEKGIANLTGFLLSKHRMGAVSLLVIDDAQNLNVESLELVRLLCNLETGQEKLLQILLVGQPELEQKLAIKELRQLKSRIVKHARLSELKKQEIVRYFEFRVNVAGAEGRFSLGNSAVEILHRATQGNLRRIHLVLDRCFYGLFSTRETVISKSIVESAVADLPNLNEKIGEERRFLPAFYFWKKWFFIGSAAVFSIVLFLSILDINYLYLNNPPAAAEKTPLAKVGGWGVNAVTSIGSPLQSADMSPRQVCTDQLQSIARADDVLQIQLFPEVLWHSFKVSPRLCLFREGSDAWVAWLGRNEASHIVAAKQATRKVQEALKTMGLLDAREPDGLFGVKTGEAFARFQQMNGLPLTGQPDDLTLLLLEHLDASVR